MDKTSYKFTYSAEGIIWIKATDLNDAMLQFSELDKNWVLSNIDPKKLTLKNVWTSDMNKKPEGQTSIYYGGE